MYTGQARQPSCANYANAQLKASTFPPKSKPDFLQKFPQINSPPLLALKLVDRPQDVTESTSCLEIQETLGLNEGEERAVRMTFQRSSHFSFHRNTKCVCVCCAYRQLGKSRIVDPASKCVLLELQQLDHQTRQGFTGGRVILDILGTDRDKKNNNLIHTPEKMIYTHIWSCTICHKQQSITMLMSTPKGGNVTFEQGSPVTLGSDHISMIGEMINDCFFLCHIKVILTNTTDR